MEKIADLLEGYIDMHVHAFPDISLAHPQHRDNETVIRECREAGMAGIVLKTHCWPAPGLARELNALYDDFSVYPSVTLNMTAGGVHPWVVEMAAAQGARVIWLPTWSAANDHESGQGFGAIAETYVPLLHTELDDGAYYQLLNKDGMLKDEVKECIALCKEKDLVLCTGHISGEESAAVGEFAAAIHYSKVVLTHARSRCAFNTFEQIRNFTAMGHYVEFCALNVAPLHTSISIDEMKYVINAIGPDHVVLSTDFFFDWVPSIPQQLYTVLGCLQADGVPYEALKIMAATPRHIMGLI